MRLGVRSLFERTGTIHYETLSGFPGLYVLETGSILSIGTMKIVSKYQMPPEE